MFYIINKFYTYTLKTHQEFFEVSTSAVVHILIFSKKYVS